MGQPLVWIRQDAPDTRSGANLPPHLGFEPISLRSAACPLLTAQRRQKARVRTEIFLHDLQAALIVQQPAEGLRRVRVLEVHPDVLATLQLDLLPGHGGRKIARRAEGARDQVEPLMARIRLVVEADLPVRLRDAYRGEQP